MWDLEFTERKALDDIIEDELVASGEKSFRNLYQCLLGHAAEQQQSAGRDGAAQVSSLLHYCTSFLTVPSARTSVCDHVQGIVHR